MKVEPIKVLQKEIKDPAFLEELFEKSTIQTFEEGDVMLDVGSFIKVIPIVLSGSLKVFRDEEGGREILLYYITAGESCIMSFLGALNHSQSKIRAVVEEKADVLLVPLDFAEKMIHTHLAWAEFMFRLYHKRFEELLDTLNSLAFQKMDERILHFLKQKSELQDGGRFIYITHQQIADELATAREVVSRLLKQMEGQGKLKLSRNKIQLLG